ncbi:hypothetical protein ACOZ4N_00225 (plasmid) [Halorientalis pallida]|uniref:hypothetical protein n=1 Tax=Halorientalis pallida TaxID=2479928 RepID=UPI003C702BC5
MFEATLRYNSPSDKDTIASSTEYLDSLVIPARMLTANRKALPSNLQNYADEAGVSYYLNPTLSDFRVGDNFRDEKGNIRSWHLKYIEAIGDPLEKLLQNNSNVSAAHLPPEQIESLTAASVEFQENFVIDQLTEERDRYDPIEDVESYAPEAVIPWYHKISQESDLQTNDTILSAAVDASDLPLKPCLFVTPSFIAQETNPEALADLLLKHDLSECFVWIEDLDKHETAESHYTHAAELIVELAEAGIAPHFFYGDYFAMMLSHLGLSGTTYGTMYGEEGGERRERTSGSGVATRYYLDGVKDFLKPVAAVDVQQRVDAEMCPCDVCSRQFDDWSDLAELANDPEQNVQAPMKKHHVRVRWHQIRTVESQLLDETLSELERDHSKYASAFGRSNQVGQKKKLDYLLRWKHAIENVTS